MKHLLDKTLGEYAEMGFSLVEIDDHALLLFFKDNRIAAYNQTKVSRETLQNDCKIYLAIIREV